MWALSSAVWRSLATPEQKEHHQQMSVDQESVVQDKLQIEKPESNSNCDKCPFITTEEVVFKHHTLMLHVPGFECHECEKMIFPDDHVLGCSNCDYFFHIHCTNLNQRGLEPTLAWRCHHCSPKAIELQTPEPTTCYLCAFEAGNKAALETHLLNKHCPDIAAQCDFCDKRFASDDILLIHIHNHHATESETSEIRIPASLKLS